MKMKKSKFNWLNIQKLPEDVHGIYAIWSRTTCIYVGKAENQSLKKRLTQHYSRCHNEKLKAWINSSHQLWFGIEPVTNLEAIDAKERNRIKKYAPLTNELLRKRENQYGANNSSI
tara:strand:- start:144 stop:491 length:348 start_codon:yes stop_codon:yes gene_type:complete